MNTFDQWEKEIHQIDCIEKGTECECWRELVEDKRRILILIKLNRILWGFSRLQENPLKELTEALKAHPAWQSSDEIHNAWWDRVHALLNKSVDE